MSSILLVLVGVLFLSGKGIVFGIEGGETQLISLPQNTVAGIALVAIGSGLTLKPIIEVVRTLITKAKGFNTKNDELRERIDKEAYNES